MKLKITLGDGTTRTMSEPTKRKISNFLQWTSEPFNGFAVVQYKKDFENSFDFSSMEDFKHKVYPCIEKDLVESFR